MNVIQFAQYISVTMYTAISFFLLSLAFAVYGLPTSHVIGGTDAVIGKYPYHVALKYDGALFCGGSIINKRYILTAAHCLKTYGDHKDLTIHAGTIYVNETGDVYQTESVARHTGYDDYSFNNDIGLVRVNRDIVYSDVVKSIPLAKKHTVAENLSCVTCGWGRTTTNGLASNTLQEIALKVYSHKKCKATYWRVNDRHICTLTKAGEGLCYGDSGSALVANGIQIGITSFVTPCAVGEPDVFTKVSEYQDWLDEHMIRDD